MVVLVVGCEFIVVWVRSLCCHGYCDKHLIEVEEINISSSILHMLMPWREFAEMTDVVSMDRKDGEDRDGEQNKSFHLHSDNW